MQNPRLASRYAKSLLDIAVEQNKLEETLKDVQLLNAICTGSRDFANMLRNPVIKGDKKQSIIDAVVGGKLSEVMKLFVKLLVNKGREDQLQNITTSFMEMYKKLKNIKTVKLTTAVPANETVRETVRKKIAEAHPDAIIEFEEKVNEELIGGLVMQMDDVMFDFSVRRDLNDVSLQFSKNIYKKSIR